MAKTVIQDVAEVIITDKVTGKRVITAEAQLSGISQAISEEDLRGGIGNKRVFLIRSDKTIDLSIRSATFDSEYMAMTQGVVIKEDDTAELIRYEELTVKDSKVTIAKEAVEGTVQIMNAKGVYEEVEAGDVTGKEVSVSADLAKDEEVVSVTYRFETDARSLAFDATKFSSKYEVQYRTIQYDLDTAKVHSEIYFVFYEAIPSGAFEMSLENGTVYTPEINFSVVAPKGDNVMGHYYEVETEELDEQGNPVTP